MEQDYGHPLTMREFFRWLRDGASRAERLRLAIIVGVCAISGLVTGLLTAGALWPS